MDVRRDGRRATPHQVDLESCMACGLVCEITGSFEMPGLDGAEPYVRTRCVAGHLMVGPAFALTAPS